MRVLLICLMALLFFACGSIQTKKTNPDKVSNPNNSSSEGLQLTDEIKKEILEKSDPLPPNPDFSNAERVGEIMNFLASDDLEGREAGTEGIAKAADYIEEIFNENGIKPYFENFRDTLSNFKKPAYNMVGMIEGNDTALKDQFIILGAHYDHIGRIKAKNGDDIANGANDNASGTTLVLELARYFGKNKTNKRSIIFALFSAEEKGLLGSKHLAKKLKDTDLNLYVMLNFEMIGVPLQHDDYLMYLTGYDLSNVASVSNSYTDKKIAGFLPKAKEFNLFNRSDNAPFHKIYNVPSHTYSTFDFTNFEHYHKVGDETDKLDFDHMANIVNTMIPVMKGIINNPEQEIKYN
jgi:hypothetical protein